MFFIGRGGRPKWVDERSRKKCQEKVKKNLEKNASHINGSEAHVTSSEQNKEKWSKGMNPRNFDATFQIRRRMVL